MALRLDKVRMLSRGASALLKSEDVRSHLTALARRVQSAQGAGSQVWQDTTDRVAVRIGTTHKGARRKEADTGYLSRSLDAAGGGAE